MGYKLRLQQFCNFVGTHEYRRHNTSNDNANNSLTNVADNRTCSTHAHTEDYYFIGKASQHHKGFCEDTSSDHCHKRLTSGFAPSQATEYKRCNARHS